MLESVASASTILRIESVIAGRDPLRRATSGPSVVSPFRVAVAGLARGTRSLDFWLLFSSVAVCGFSTNGLVATHLIPYCNGPRHPGGQRGQPVCGHGGVST